MPLDKINRMRPFLDFLLTLTILCILSDSLHAQVSALRRAIEWEESHAKPVYRDSTIFYPPGVRYLSFKNAHYPDMENLYPHYYEMIPVKDFNSTDRLILEDVEYNILTEEESREIQGLERLPGQFDFQYKIAYQQGQPAIQLNLLPLRRDPVTGEIQKITAFTLHPVPDSGASPALPVKKQTDILSSVLATGRWYKIKISSDGIYKLTYEELEKLGFSNPGNIRIYGNGGKGLPFMNDEPRPVDLQENAIFMNKGSDGVFSKGDYILFFGKGVLSWSYDPSAGFYKHSLNDYSEAAYYFLTTDLGPGKIIENITQPAGSVTHTVTSFDERDYYEKNINNLIQSGRQWFGNKIFSSAPFDTTFNFPELVLSSPVRLLINAASRSENSKTFTLRSQDKYVGAVSVKAVNLDDFTGTYANQSSGFFSFSPASEKVNISVSYNKTEYADNGWLDYITLNVRRNLVMKGDAMFFRDMVSVGAGNLSRFLISGVTQNTLVWDITDPSGVRSVESDVENNMLSFISHTDSLREFLVLNPAGNFPRPVTEGSELGWVENQNLRGTPTPDMLIVTHPLFLDQAEILAEYHRNHEGMSVLVVTSRQIYHEFSSGAPDVCAIRDYARLLYKQSDAERQLKYLLLFGDGSYNNHLQFDGNSNFILTYQSLSSLNHISSYLSDDFFGFLDDHEGGSERMEDFLLDIGVGRLPVKTTLEAQAVVEKIMEYHKPENMRGWRNNILFVGDDQDNNLHMNQANELADLVGKRYPQFTIKKLLIDAFVQTATSRGARYPDVEKAIYNDIHQGSLIFNYTGHGGEKGLAEEQILTREQLEKYSNAPRLPLFVTATCEFSRFDDLVIDDKGTIKELTSAGEVSILNPNGGSIGLLSTTRVVFSIDNHNLNTKFYNYIFQRNEDGQYHRLGDVIRLTKNATGASRNKLNFTLLGDPALRLAIPGYTVITDTLNGIEITGAIDTLKAFSEITVKGHMVSDDNMKMNDFNGIIYPVVFDKARMVTTLGNDGGSTIAFSVQENIIYNGKANVKNGDFSFSFLVPKDITYSYGKGKITYYAEDSASDANGYFNEFVIGGTGDILNTDDAGPTIALYLNDENFNPEGITDNNPIIYALISDESGINTSGNGIGHDIIGIIDGDATKPLVMNSFYESELDDYQRGSLRYPLTGLSVGWHSVRLRVWDIYNNPSEALLEFEVLDKEGIVLRKAYNYPNPAVEYTFFQFEHNKAGSELKVTIDIFNLSGQKIITMTEIISAMGFHSSPLEWDLRDQNGNPVQNGIFPYRIRVEDESGNITDAIQKLIIMRNP